MDFACIQPFHSSVCFLFSSKGALTELLEVTAATSVSNRKNKSQNVAAVALQHVRGECNLGTMKSHRSKIWQAKVCCIRLFSELHIRCLQEVISIVKSSLRRQRFESLSLYLYALWEYSRSVCKVVP